MTHLIEDAFSDLDLGDLDILDVEVIRTSLSTGLPEQAASCCLPHYPCSSCCIENL